MKKYLIIGLCAFGLVSCHQTTQSTGGTVANPQNQPLNPIVGHMNIILDGIPLKADTPVMYAGSIMVNGTSDLNVNANFTHTDSAFLVMLNVPNDYKLTTYNWEWIYQRGFAMLRFSNQWPVVEYQTDSGSMAVTMMTHDSIAGAFSYRLIGKDSIVHRLSGNYVAVF